MKSWLLAILRRSLRICYWPAAAATLAGSACVVPIEPAHPIPLAQAHPRGVRSLMFSRDGRVLAAASLDGPVILWDAETQEPMGPPVVPQQAGLRAVSLSPDAAVVAVGNEDGTVVLWDARLGQDHRTTLPGRHPGAVTSVAFSPDGQSLASGSRDGTVLFWDVGGRREIDRLASLGHVQRVLYSPDGRLLAVADSHHTTLWDTGTRRPLGPALNTSGNGFEELAFSADGGLLARTGGGFCLWDVAARRCLWGSEKGCELRDDSMNQHAGVAISPDGRLLASAERGERVVELWDLETRERIARLPGHGGRRLLFFNPYGNAGTLSMTNIHALAFSPDGRILVSGGDDRAIIFWDVVTWPPIPRRNPSTPVPAPR